MRRELSPEEIAEIEASTVEDEDEDDIAISSDTGQVPIVPISATPVPADEQPSSSASPDLGDLVHGAPAFFDGLDGGHLSDLDLAGFVPLLLRAKEALRAYPSRPPPNSNAESRDSDGGSIGTRRSAVRERARARIEDAKDGGRKTSESEVLDLPLSQIRAGHVRNIRRADVEEKLEALSSSIAIHGLVNPILVERDPVIPDRYNMIAGHRRFRAVSQLGWATIRATVRPPTTDEAAALICGTENLARHEISPYELAVHATETCERFGLSLPEYARRVGAAEGTVMKAAWILENLPPEILQAWRDGHPLATVSRLERLAGRREEASDLWAREIAKHARDDVPLVSEEVRYTRGRDSRPPKSDLQRLKATVRRDPTLLGPVKRIALQILAYATGDSDEVLDLGWKRTRRRRRRSATHGVADAPDLPLPDQSQHP